LTSATNVTVVVATRDRWQDLEQTLPRHDAPVLLVDNGSKDGTPDLVTERFPDVEVVRLGENRGAVARNIGVKRARTPYVAFADDDSWWAPGALRHAARVFDAHPRLGLIAADMRVGPDQRRDSVCELMARSPLGRVDGVPGPSVLGFLACGAVVRKEAFLTAGGFDDVIFFMGEEERLALDLATLGWHLAYVEDVVAHHHPSPSRADPTARRARAVRNRVLTAVLRRPWPAVGRSVVRALGDGRPGRRGVLRAVPKLPRALLHRKVVPADVEAARRLLEVAHEASRP